MRTLDIFPYCDEVDLAVLRINHLASVVDHFLVAEFNTSFSGITKGYSFEKVLSQLPLSLAQKISYFPLKQEQVFPNHFENDDFQKNTMIREIVSLINQEDIILIGDCDEVPSIDAITTSVEFIRKGINICHLAQRNFLGFINVEEVSGYVLSFTGDYRFTINRKWLGTVATTKSMLLNNLFSGLRHPQLKSVGRRISKGGWHFSSCNGYGLSFQERIREKYRLTAHQEFNRQELLDGAFDRLRNGQDPFLRTFPGRFKIGITEPKYKIRPLDESFPVWLLHNASKFQHLILRG